jgi:hypothetical protein
MTALMEMLPILSCPEKCPFWGLALTLFKHEK